ncbi:hypothetical protein PPL_08848 [Heterostelium album PN500]|uniref:Uncharacterized protein n=1 Tax=Heterostelium pallidum (strain ATCC 26659 / Pp 5 / PN500) TaxID=670386 RepID=D3BJW8_HETP5|nr:hypothetical protein PPL_08848 [Heterostelium album PN500]EFA78198.1 hypothetical protein PPL_08848 [Heterostelium album PN500]|eukprot:XP_020430324.1 hypothetical protein PPL_08848 [Heterostelium album PN500]
MDLGAVETEELLAIIDEVKLSFVTNNEVANIDHSQSIHKEITNAFIQQQDELSIVVKDLTQKLIAFEKNEMNREDSDEVHNSKLKQYQDQRRAIQLSITQLENDILDLKKTLTLSKEQSAKLKEREQQLEKQKNQLIPYQEHLFALYSAISLIRWDIPSEQSMTQDNNVVTGIMSKPKYGKISKISLDPVIEDRFEMTERDFHYVATIHKNFLIIIINIRGVDKFVVGIIVVVLFVVVGVAVFAVKRDLAQLWCERSLVSGVLEILPVDRLKEWMTLDLVGTVAPTAKTTIDVDHNQLLNQVFRQRIKRWRYLLGDIALTHQLEDMVVLVANERRNTDEHLVDQDTE